MVQFHQPQHSGVNGGDVLHFAVKDEVPTVSESPDTIVDDTPTPEIPETEVSPLADLSGVMGMGHQPANDEGQQVAAEAVDDTSEAEVDVSGDTTTETEPEADPVEVNFDGFSDETKKTYEQLLEGGHISTEFIEQERKNTLFQADYTRKSMAAADTKRAWEAEVDQKKADLDLLEQIRGNPTWNDAWQRMASGEHANEPVEGDDEFVDGAKSKEIARAEFERLEAAKVTAASNDQRVYDKKRDDVIEAVNETILALGVTPAVMQTYLEEEQALLPAGVDPIRDLTPLEIQNRVTIRHERVKADAKIAALEEQLTQRTSKDVRTSKQSMQPPTSRADSTELSASRQTEVDLGLTPGWGNVQGLGFRD